MIYGGLFDVSSKEQEIKQLEEAMNASDFWDNRRQAEETIKKLNTLKKVVENLKEVKANLEANLATVQELTEEDEELKALVIDELEEIEPRIKALEIDVLLSKEHDDCDAILEIHAGAGGTEACDWAIMLYRMYTKWCEKHGYKMEVLDYQEGEETGIKSVSVRITGYKAYGYLKSEKGVHRLVRISPFDSNARRHTSFASVDVTPEFDNNIEIEINDKDLKIDVFRSSGAGGQCVNTTDSAVRITHLPTKIVVTCQNQRSQIQNRETALNVLKSKLYNLELEKQEQELRNLKGEKTGIEWGAQIRSYVMHPYSLVKDHRTNFETSNVTKVLDGEIDDFIDSYLKEGTL